MGLTRLFGGASGITNQPQGLDIGIGGSNIKSIQRGTTSFLAASTTLDVTISEVDVNKSIVMVSTVVTAQDQALYTIKTIGCGARITTSTNLNLIKQTGDKNITVSWEIIEFNNVKSLQRGSVSTVGLLNITQSINAVNLNKSILYTNSRAASGYTVYSEKSTYTERFSNSTQLEFKQNNVSTDTIYWEVIEFN